MSYSGKNYLIDLEVNYILYVLFDKEKTYNKMLFSERFLIDKRNIFQVVLENN